MSHRTRALCIATVAVAAVLLPNAAWAQTRLNATVGPGFTITLRDAAGANVTHLPVGHATRSTSTTSAIEHNFHLPGPWRRQVHRGRAGRHGHLDRELRRRRLHVPVRPAREHDERPVRGRDGDAPAASSATSAASATQARRQDADRDRRAGGDDLAEAGGKKVTRLKAGRYRIVVRDRSHMHNFHLTGPGVNKKTVVVAHRHVTTWTVTLQEGPVPLRVRSAQEPG